MYQNQSLLEQSPPSQSHRSGSLALDLYKINYNPNPTIPMHNLLLMTIIDCRQYLFHYLCCLNLREACLLCQLIKELSPSTQLSYDVEELIILIEFIDLNYIRVVLLYNTITNDVCLPIYEEWRPHSSTSPTPPYSSTPYE